MQNVHSNPILNTSLPAQFRLIRIELARETGHPEGDADVAYVIVAPLDADDRIDPTLWRKHREACRIARLRPTRRTTTVIWFIVKAAAGCSTTTPRLTCRMRSGFTSLKSVSYPANMSRRWQVAHLPRRIGHSALVKSGAKSALFQLSARLASVVPNSRVTSQRAGSVASDFTTKPSSRHIFSIAEFS